MMKAGAFQAMGPLDLTCTAPHRDGRVLVAEGCQVIPRVVAEARQDDDGRSASKEGTVEGQNSTASVGISFIFLEKNKPEPLCVLLEAPLL
jgi:hypothetical protein